MQPKIQNQPWGKKGNDTTPAMTSSKLEILLNTAGNMGDKINNQLMQLPWDQKRRFTLRQEQNLEPITT